MILNLSFIVLFSVLLYLAALVYKSNQNAISNKLFSATTLFFAFWAFFNYFENEPLLVPYTSLLLRLDFFTASFIVLFWLYFCLHFDREKRLGAVGLTAIALPAVIMSLLAFSPSIIHDIRFDGEKINYKEGELYFAYAIFIILYVISGCIILVSKYRKSKGEKQIQILYIISGLALTLVIESIVNLFAQNQLSLAVFRLAIFGILFFVGSTAYAIMKHKLFDIRPIVQRGMAYSFLLTLIVSAYILLVSVISLLFSQKGEAAIYWGAGTVMILGIFGAPRIEKYFQKITKNIFYKNKYDYSKALVRLSQSLNKNVELEPMLKGAVTELQNVLQPEKIAVIFPGKDLMYTENKGLVKFNLEFPPFLISFIESSESNILLHDEIHKELNDAVLKRENPNDRDTALAAYNQADLLGKKHGIMVSVALISDGKLIGLVVLGEKKSGDRYSADDLDLLNTFSFQASTAIEKAQLYEEVKNYSVTLEDKVKKRTAKIKSIQEEQLQTMLEIAHGLQTPLTIMKGKLETINIEPNEKVSFSRAIDRISKFIYDMLNLSRLEADAVEIKKEKLNLSDLIDELAEGFEVITAEQGIRIERKIEPDIWILGNKQKIEELVTNLVSNSAKYFRTETEKFIRISLEKKEEAVIAIEDNGIGISKEDLPKLFHKFFRVSDGTKKGTGLGLAICKVIAERHKGKILVESKFGVGTKFKVSLPCL